MITIKMPVPISANQRLIRTRGRQLTNSKVYREWFNKAYWQIKTQTHDFETIEGRVGVSITVHFKDHRRRDLDNILKGFQDVCTKSQIWNDDCQIDNLHVVRGEVIKGGYLEARIWEIGEEVDQIYS